MTVNGGAGNDQFTVYSNKAALQLNGNDGNDTFELRAFALAAVNSTDPNTWTDDTIIFDTIDGVSVARPLLSGDGSEVLYNLNAAVGVDGGNGSDTMTLVGTEFPDDIVITAAGIYGINIQATYTNLELIEIDGMESDDEFFVLTTNAGVGTRLIGNLGSDTVNVAGDVVKEIDTSVTLPAATHLLAGLAGPLAVEGGKLGDRALKTAAQAAWRERRGFVRNSNAAAGESADRCAEHL